MENRIGSSRGAQISRKSRSLFLKSLYESKTSQEVRPKSLKRKVGGGGDEKINERKRSRKSVSLSSFKNFKSIGSKSLEEVYNGSLSSGSHDSKNLKSGLSHRLKGGSKFSSVTLTLGSVVKIPRRKRDFIGRRKVENGSKVWRSGGQCGAELRNADRVGELICGVTSQKVDPSEVNQKEGFDECKGNRKSESDSGKLSQNEGFDYFKENRNGESNLGKLPQKEGFDDFKENRNGESKLGKQSQKEDGHAGHIVNNDLSFKKSLVDHLVENNGDSSRKKSPRKRSRKRKDLVADSKSAIKEAEKSTDACIKISDVLHDDDEENLEENAARMLSSRFDPSCTGFCPNNQASSIPSINGLSFASSSCQDFVTCGFNYVSGSESSSIDTAGRVLRPRKQTKVKGNTRRRRHYYEVLSGDLDADWVVNRRIKVFWPLDESWYYGLVSDYDQEKKLHHVKYDDRDEEWINLQNERFKLLLLPGEVPGKTNRKRSVKRVKPFDKEKGRLKARKEKKRVLTMGDNGNEGNCMDSEPIISWLARSTHKVKPSPVHALKRRKTLGVASTSVPSYLSGDGGSLNRDRSKLCANSTLLNRSDASERSEVSAMESSTCPKDCKLPVVYFRRRFRKMDDSLCHTSVESRFSTKVLDSDPLHAPVAVGAGSVGLDSDEILWLIDNTGLVKLNIALMESGHLSFKFNFPVLSVLNYPCVMENMWLFHTALLFQHGTVMTLWPRVHLEMLFVDSIVGLRLLLFEGCLKQAVAIVFLILTVLDQPNNEGDLRLPVTSVRLKFSCIQDLKKQLVFALYNFSKVKSSKWMYLDYQLQRHCFLTRRLSVSECTYDNIKALQNGSNGLLSSSVCKDSISVKGVGRRSRQCISLIGVSTKTTSLNASQSSNSDKNHRCFLPFHVSFAAVPTFFLGLHLKLIMERNVTRISFQDHDSIQDPEKFSSQQAEDHSSVEEISNRGSESTLDSHSKVWSRDGGCVQYISCAKEPETVGLSVCKTGGCMKSSPECQSGDVDVETFASHKDPGTLGTNAVVLFQKMKCHHSESEQCSLSPKSSVDGGKSKSGSHSLLNGITVEIPTFNEFDKPADTELRGAQQSNELSWNMNGGIIPSPNPTARRSTWHRNKSSSTSFGYLSHRWADGRADVLQKNFGTGPKKPRTQVSYAFPFGGFDYSSKNKNHQQKGFPHKRIRTANEKKLSDVSRGPERNLELLSCDVNLLITLGDRGWREFGAQVVLELFDHNEWRLAVKISGTTKYTYKAHQFLQPGTTNRFTHAMTWKGGKDWTLEFPDRSQWALFREMHEECYNRNIRAASVKNIPIPGVHLIEHDDDNGVEVPFFRNSKYFRQIETDVEMALNPSRVLYDMDDEDEQWMLKNQISVQVDDNRSWVISEELFEKTMDMFEKAAYTQQRDQFTSHEIEELMSGVGQMDAIKAIYEHWQQKRRKKGVPLIRHLQPPLWERYRQQVKEWDLAMNKSSIILPNGCHEKVAPSEKPPMFAFCLKPRGLEVPNKGLKQRSQRKFSISGQGNAFSLDHDGFLAYGRRSNGFASGDEKVLHQYESFDDSPLLQASPRVVSPWDAGSAGYFSMIGERYDRNRLQKLHGSKSKKILLSPKDVQIDASFRQRMFDMRNGDHRWNMGSSDWQSERHYHLEGFLGHGHLDGLDLDEFRLCDASGAAQHARKMAKLKRERAQRLLYRADLAIHRAAVALMTAEAMKASSEGANVDG